MTEIFDNINALYNFSKPCEELTDYIEFFSQSSCEETASFTGNHSFTIKMFPSWTPTIWINLGKPYVLQMSEQRFSIGAKDDILILRDGSVIRHNSPKDEIFTIKFYPGALERLMNVSQSGLIGQVLNAADIIPATLINQIKTLDSFNQRKALFENFLLKQIKPLPADHYIKLVRDSIDFCHIESIQYNTSAIAEKMFVTSKTINRYFHKVVGTSPKKYFTILRSRKALISYMSDRKNFDPELYGYYDMSHFYKGMMHFTGERLAVR